jgi:hypothetical protein
VSSGRRPGRGTALAGVVVPLVLLATGCTLGPDGSEESAGTPWQEWITPDAACPVTLPVSPDRYPEGLREQEGKDTWYGEGPLWVDLAGFYDPARLDDAVRAQHAWWTVDRSGRATSDVGPPVVRATRLDGPGREVAMLHNRADGPQTWWSAVLTFPEPGCWLVTGTLDDTVVRLVVKAR